MNGRGTHGLVIQTRGIAITKVREDLRNRIDEVEIEIAVGEKAKIAKAPTTENGNRIVEARTRNLLRNENADLNCLLRRISQK